MTAGKLRGRLVAVLRAVFLGLFLGSLFIAIFGLTGWIEIEITLCSPRDAVVDLKNGRLGFHNYAYRYEEAFYAKWDYADWHLGKLLSYVREHSDIDLSVAAWIPLLVLGTPSAFALWTMGRRRRIPPGHCQNCGYNLTGNISGRCPECGTAVNHKESSV